MLENIIINQLNRQLGYKVIALLLLVLVISPCYSKDAPAFNWQLDLGISLQHKTNVIDSLDHTDGDISLALLGAGGIYYENFFIECSSYTSQPLTFGYTVSETNNTSISVVGTSWFSTISEQYQQQGNRLDGLSTRHRSLEVGIEYLQQFKRSELRVTAISDALGLHNGFLFSVDHSLPLYRDKWVFIPSWELTYFSKHIVDYYLGVAAHEVTPNRSLYQASSGWSLTGRLYVEYPIDDDWSFFAFAAYSKLSNSITNSPITSVNSATHVLAVGALWSF